MVRRSWSTSAAPRSPTFPEPTWGGIIAEIVVLDDALPQLTEIKSELPGAALRVVDNPADVCCRIGFHAAAVREWALRFPDHVVLRIDAVHPIAREGMRGGRRGLIGV